MPLNRAAVDQMVAVLCVLLSKLADFLIAVQWLTDDYEAGIRVDVS